MFKKFRYSDSAPMIAERSVVSPSIPPYRYSLLSRCVSQAVSPAKTRAKTH